MATQLNSSGLGKQTWFAGMRQHLYVSISVFKDGNFAARSTNACPRADAWCGEGTDRCVKEGKTKRKPGRRSECWGWASRRNKDHLKLEHSSVSAGKKQGRYVDVAVWNLGKTREIQKSAVAELITWKSPVNMTSVVLHNLVVGVGFLRIFAFFSHFSSGA